jgi:hypothetical protein
VLTIAANLLGATGIVWTRGARLALAAGQASAGARALKWVLLGAVTVDGVQGVLLSVDSADEIQRVTDDPSLTPTEKVNKILEILRGLAIAGTLLYINVKGTATDVKNLSRAPQQAAGASPEAKLKSLADPAAELDLREPPVVEGHTSGGKHKTTVQIDQHAETPHASGRVHDEHPREIPPAGPQRTNNLDQLYNEASVAQSDLNDLTRAVASNHGGEPVIPPTLKGRARAQEKIAAEYDGDASRIVDLARSSIEFKNFRELEAALRDIASSAKVVRMKDRFAKPLPSGYRDVLLNVEMKNGHVVEMQLHLKSILEVKGGIGHKLYEQERSILAKAKQENRPMTAAELTRMQELQAEAKRHYDEALAAAQKGGNP